MVLRTRGYSFRAALPEILKTMRRITARAEESRCGADRMIADYRAIIARISVPR